MSSIWDWWWNNVGAGGISKGFKRGEKAGEKVGHDINQAVGLPDTPDLGGAINDVKDGVNLAKVVWFNVSDFRMWRSLGWLLLGIFLMVLGFVVWNRKSIQAVAGTAARFAV